MVGVAAGAPEVSSSPKSPELTTEVEPVDESAPQLENVSIATAAIIRRLSFCDFFIFDQNNASNLKISSRAPYP